MVQISFFLDPQERTPQQILEDWPSLVDCAEMAAHAGARVTVIQASFRPESLTRNGVRYHFVAPRRRGSAISDGEEFKRVLQELNADVFHVHGLSFPRDVIALAKASPGIPILMQDHADGVPRLWRRPHYRLGMSAAAGISFCALPQAAPFRKARLILPHLRLFEIAESTSRFSPGDQSAARQITGVRGDPALLWVGHLDSNKDPMTVLKGIEKAALALPDLQLWLCFRHGPLLEQVQDCIDSDPLKGKVHLIGNVSHQSVEQLMRAADIFVLGSHREGSGYSLIEALACGLPPVITDIPSFRMLTGNGCVGALWPCGASSRLCDALIAVAQLPRREQRELARAQFDRELSFAAIGQKLNAAYRQLIEGAAHMRPLQ